jgi:betaine-aldehyde dehydrogenase
MPASTRLVSTRPPVSTPQRPGAERTMTITDPRDDSPVGSLPVTAEAVLPVLVARSRAAALRWSRTAPSARGLRLRDAAAVLRAHEQELAELNARETGRPVDQALDGVRAGAATLLQYAELGPLHRGRSLQGNIESADYTVDRPRGVALLLTPWNDPVAVAMGLIGAALATGNTVLHNPSERCPHLGARLGTLLAPVFPPDVLMTVDGDGATGAALTALPGIDVIAHVGSSPAGRRILRAASVTGAHTILENGGNDSLIIDADVDPEWAAGQAATGAFANSGQICTAVERVYVHERIAREFIDALARLASGLNDAGVLGPLVGDVLRENVHAQVSDAVLAGASLLTGGIIPDGGGSFYPATVLGDCHQSMMVMRDETFGPVAAITAVDTFDEALELACEGDFGLAATVLTGSIGHAQAAVARLPVGTVKINAVFGGAPGGSAQPRGASGRGFGYGPELLDEMTTTTVVHLEAAVLDGRS